MRIQRKTLCLLIVLGLSYSVSAQAQSLLDAAQSALAHDARWQAQTLATQAAAHRSAQGRALLLPQIGLQAGTQHSDSEVRLSTPQGQQTHHLPAWERHHFTSLQCARNIIALKII